jgi:quinol monooxygenase YgiN
MIVIHAKVETAPGAIGALRTAIATMEKASRAEAGCVEYVFTSSLESPSTIRIFEQWRSVDALKAHFATPHMAAFNAAMRAHPPKSLDVKAFEANEIPFPR